MTSQSPRIYTYQIPFEAVPYYYYGVHKEKKFNEAYWGTPVTHKWAWEFYTPKKQILELFDYSDGGWNRAKETEERLIRPFYNTDKWCLNANCGGKIELEVIRKSGLRLYREGKGIHSFTFEQLSQMGKQRYAEKSGIHSQTLEEKQELGRKTGKRMYEEGRGVFSVTPEQRKEINKKINSQVWKCTVTGFETTAGPLSRFQMRRGIDTSNRIRIK